MWGAVAILRAAARRALSAFRWMRAARLGRNRCRDAPIEGIEAQSAQHTGEPARCWLRCLRCWLRCLRCWPRCWGIEMLVIEIECSEQQMLADDAGRCCGLGRCYWQILLAYLRMIAALRS
jgi:hypothetical protein